RVEYMDYASRREIEDAAATSGRSYRSANGSGTNNACNRSCNGFAFRHHTARNRSDALRRVRAATDLDALHAIKSVSRDSGNPPELSKQSGKVAGHLRAIGKRHLCAAQHFQPFRIRNSNLGPEPAGTIPGR